MPKPAESTVIPLLDPHQAALEAAAGCAAPADRIATLRMAVEIARWQEDLRAELATIETMHREVEDRAGMLDLLVRRAVIIETLDERSHTSGWNDVRDVAREVGDDERLAMALYELHLLGNDKALQEAARMETAWSQLARARPRMMSGDWHSSEPFLLEALTSARHNRDTFLEAMVLNGLGFIWSYTNRIQDATAAFGAARDLFLMLGHLNRSYVAVTNLSNTYLEDGRTLDATNILQRAAATLSSTTGLQTHAFVRGHLAHCLLQVDAAASLRLAHAAIADLEQSSQIDSSAAFVRITYARAMVANGITDQEPAEALNEARRILLRFPFNSYSFEADVVQATLAEARGQVADIAAMLVGVQVDESQSMTFLALWMLRRGTWHDHAPLVHGAQKMLVAVDDGALAAEAMCRAEFDALLTRDVEAIERMRDTWDRAGRPVDAGECEALAGRVCLRDAQSDRGTRLLMSAHRRLVDCGSLLRAAEVSSLLQSLSTVPRSAFAREADLLVGLNRAERKRATSLMTTMPFRRHRVFFHEDQPAQAMYLIQSGHVVLSAVAGEKRVLTLLQAGDLFGEHSVGPGANSMNGLRAEAVDDGVVAILAPTHARRMINEFPAIGTNLASALSERLHHWQLLARDLAYGTVRERLAHVLLDLDDRFGHPTLDGRRMVSLPLSQVQLASMVGATRKAVSVLFTELRADDVIDLRGKRVVIHDRAALEAMATPAMLP